MESLFLCLHFLSPIRRSIGSAMSRKRWSKTTVLFWVNTLFVAQCLLFWSMAIKNGIVRQNNWFIFRKTLCNAKMCQPNYDFVKDELIIKRTVLVSPLALTCCTILKKFLTRAECWTLHLISFGSNQYSKLYRAGNSRYRTICLWCIGRPE